MGSKDKRRDPGLLGGKGAAYRVAGTPRQLRVGPPAGYAKTDKYQGALAHVRGEAPRGKNPQKTRYMSAEDIHTGGPVNRKESTGHRACNDRTLAQDNIEAPEVCRERTTQMGGGGRVKEKCEMEGLETETR